MINREREAGRRLRDRGIAVQDTGGRGVGAKHAACCTMQHPLTDWKVGRARLIESSDPQLWSWSHAAQSSRLFDR